MQDVDWRLIQKKSKSAQVCKSWSNRHFIPHNILHCKAANGVKKKENKIATTTVRMLLESNFVKVHWGQHPLKAWQKWNTENCRNAKFIELIWIHSRAHRTNRMNLGFMTISPQNWIGLTELMYWTGHFFYRIWKFWKVRSKDIHGKIRFQKNMVSEICICQIVFLIICADQKFFLCLNFRQRNWNRFDWNYLD